MTSTGSVQRETPAAGTYAVDPQRSTIAYSGRHLFGLAAVHATFTISSGQVRITGPVTGSTVTATIDAASFHSTSAKRDSDVRSARFLDAEQYPDISFRSRGLTPDGDRWRLAGTVTAHGTEVPVDVVVDRVAHEGAGLRLHARAEHLDRYAFGITGGKGMAGRYLDLDLDVLAVPV